MSPPEDVMVYARSIQLEVVIPEQYAYELMRDFGEAFAHDDPDFGKRIAPVDDYFNNPGGWHIVVTVWDREEAEFYDFLEAFCLERHLSLRDPRASS